MKNLLLILSLTMLISSPAFAKNKVPNPVVTLSADAVEVTRVLTSTGVEKCIDQIQKASYDTRWGKVTRQPVDKRKTLYRFKGVQLEGGDMVSGKVKLTVLQKWTEGFGATRGRHYSHTCKVTFQKID